jgi:hypothetical protein
MSSTATFEPFDVLYAAAEHGQVAFMIWFYDIFDVVLTPDEGLDLVNNAIESGSEATLKFCLKIWDHPCGGAAKLGEALGWAVSARNKPAAIWLHDRGAVAEKLNLYGTCISGENWCCCSLGQFMKMLDERGFSFVLSAKEQNA